VLFRPVKARAIYSYEATGSDELALEAGDVVDIVDSPEDEWWKAERNGAVLLVPSAFLELMG
jgi:hypothetical protein